MPDKITPERIAELRDVVREYGQLGRTAALQLLDALEASLKDGERLDKLEALGSVEIECSYPSDRYSIGNQINGGYSYANLRAAIDAAMKKEG